MKSEGAAFRGACARARKANAAKRGDGSVTVLDFGSGDGRYLLEFLRTAEAVFAPGETLKILAYDVSPGALRAFRRRCLDAGFVEARGAGDDAAIGAVAKEADAGLAAVAVEFLAGDPVASPKAVEALLRAHAAAAPTGDAFDVALSGWGSTSAIPDLEDEGPVSRQDGFVRVMCRLAPTLVQVVSSRNNFIEPQKKYARLRAAKKEKKDAPSSSEAATALDARIRLAVRDGDFYYPVAGHEYFFSAVSPRRERARLLDAGFTAAAVSACNVASFRDILASPRMAKLERAALAFVARDDHLRFQLFLSRAVARATGRPVARTARLFDPNRTLVDQAARYIVSVSARPPKRA